MLSRVADSIYWMFRYIERAENVSRFIEVNHHLSLDLPVQETEQWQPLVTTTGDLEDFRERYGQPTRHNVLAFLTFDTTYPNSIISCVTSARENARAVRDAVSSEMWRCLNTFYMMVSDAATQADLDDPHAFFDQVKQHSHLFAGVTDDTMSHGEGYNFARMGRLIERADKTSRILDVKYYMILPEVGYVGTPFDNIQWAAVLKSASALEMYRKRFHRISPNRVAEFLILDPYFPRAIHYCLIALAQSMHSITGAPAGTFLNTAERQLGRLRAELDYTDIEEVFEVGLHEYLDGLQSRLNRVDQAIYDTFFALRPPAPRAASR